MMSKRMLIFLGVMLQLWVCAQTYPSHVTTSLYQPYSIFLDEYTNPLLPKIKASIVFDDHSETSWDVYLKLKITGPNITIESKPGIKPPEYLTVLPGIPFELSGADLDWYFNNDHLIFSGITRAKLEANNNRLPEGFYSFCFEVIDYHTNKKISLPHSASAYLALNDPPIVLAPVCGNAVENLSQQNILFQWQIANTNGNLNVGTLSYQIDLYEVNNSYSNPQMAITNNQALPIWQSQPITQNTYVYGPAEPPLEKGKRYVFTVKAIEQGKSQIKNNGYSQACWFYYGYPEGGTINLLALPNNHQLKLSDNGYFTWSKPNNVIHATQMVAYQFQIVRLFDGQDPENALLNNTPFYQTTFAPSTSNPKNLSLPVENMMRLERMKPYVWQVKGFSGQQEIAKSEIRQFTGPPVIEKFYAGGFEVTVTNLMSFDSLTYKVSGKGKVMLNNTGEAPEFSFSDIYLNPIGNNTWVMSNGIIKDKIIVNPHLLQSDSVVANKTAEFSVDSILIDLDHLYLGGVISWKFPLGVAGNNIPYLYGKHQNLILGNDFKLYSQNYNELQEDYTLNLLEPGGFSMRVDQSSQIVVTASKYNWKFNGYVELPTGVKDAMNTEVTIPYSEVGQLFFIRQTDITNAEGIRLVTNTNMDLKPMDYVLDFSEKTSEGDFAFDPTWKGLYMSKASMMIHMNAESSGQLSASSMLSGPIFNEVSDSVKLYVNQLGLTFEGSVAFNPVQDTLRFNSFPTVQNEFNISINDNVVYASHLTGKIQIPVLDTAGAFPYFIKLDANGFGQGYLLNALSNYSFVFNAYGGNEQKIHITLTKAIFKNNNRLEMDLNLVWPHFQLSLNQVQKFCAWGNGNIGFETPNGILPLSYQEPASASGYDLQVERIGCGRVANLYSFGISSRIVMSDDIAGDNGAPIVNAYSMYKNPLLSGDFTNMTFDMGTSDSVQVDSNGVKSNVSDNLVTNVGQTLSDIGVGSYSGGDASISGIGEASGHSGVIISSSTYLDLQRIVVMAEAFVELLGPDNSEVAQGYIDIAKVVLNSDLFQKAVGKSPEELVNQLIMETADAVVSKINRPIEKLSYDATSKIRTAINTKVVQPVTLSIDTLISKALEKIKQQLINAFDQEQTEVRQVVAIVVNSVKTNLSNEIRNAIVSSVETNVTSKITGFISVGITNRVTGFVRNEVKTVATNIINTGFGNSVNLNNIVDHAEELFKDLGDTIVNAIQAVNLNTIKNTVETIGDDIVKGISFERIGENILNELANKGLSAAVNGVIQNQLKNLGGNGGGVAAAVLSTVKFDFSNVGDKIKNGQLDQIVKFDFTNIYIKTKAAEVQGQLKFTKDDPIYGDSFQAFVFAKINIPNEEKPITGSLKFVNGKTTQAPENFAYWFFGGKLMGLDLKLGSIPFTIDGFEGDVYHKMKLIGNPTPMPDITNKYGVYAGMYMFDTPTGGKIIRFDVGLGVEVASDNFAIELKGKADIGNTKVFSVATATGTMGYYSAQKLFQGKFGVTFNTAPLLCAGGEMGVKVDGKNNTWQVYIGTKESPVGAKLLCKDFLASGGYFDMKKSGIEAGFMLNVNVDAQTPWVGGDNLKVRGSGHIGFGIDAYTIIAFEPKFKINEAYVHAWASASLGFDYQTKVNSGSITIAGVSLEGDLLYKNTDEPQASELHGAMSGVITILNTDIGVDMRVDYDVANRTLL